MRKILSYSMFGLILTFVSTGCGGPKPITDARDSETLNIPCQNEDQFRSNAEYYRASAQGASSKLSVAKKIAMQNARAALATKTESTVKRTIDNYVQQQDINDKRETKQKFEEISRTVVRQELNDVRTNCSKVTKKEDSNDYTYYINLEMSKKALIDAMNDEISKKEELKMEYDKQKMEETMEKEMKKLDESRP
jgi:hypothetical protein